MKPLQIIFRAGLGFVIGLVFSLSQNLALLRSSDYTQIDRAFLILVPTFAVAYVFFEFYPSLQKWMASTRLGANHSVLHYVIGFFLSLLLGYGAVGFLDEALQTAFGVFLFTLIFISTSCTIGYYLVHRAAWSFRSGFLRKPLNVFLCLMLPIFFITLLVVSARFPAMFVWEYITIPARLAGAYFAGALLAGILGMQGLNQFDLQRFQATKLFAFVKENLPGLYASGMFFLINLVIARALNHPAFSYNSVVFETDAGPWMTILASPESDAINRAVHPLVLITSRPLVRLLGMFMGEHWNLAAILVVAMLSGLCVLMAYLFVKHATGADTYSFLFAILLGSTSTHLLFGSLTENYVFGMTSLIFFLLLVQSGEKRLSRLVPMGVIVFGITVTNIAQTVIGLFFNKNFVQSQKSTVFVQREIFEPIKTLARYCFLVIILGVSLTVLTNTIYPGKQTFFFVPADLAFEGRFVKPTYESPLASAKENLQVVTRTMFLYEIVAPEPLVVISQKKSDPFPTIDLKTYDAREHKLASYKGASNLPLALWLCLLAGAFLFFAKNARTSKHLPLILGLLGSLGFNFLMHLMYGTELFLYTPYWMYALVGFVALAYAELADKKWFEVLLAGFIAILMVNNGWFVYFILRALAPFFAT